MHLILNEEQQMFSNLSDDVCTLKLLTDLDPGATFGRLAVQSQPDYPIDVRLDLG